MKANCLAFVGMALLLADYKLSPLQGKQPKPAVASPVRSALISLDRLLWLREQSFAVADSYLRNRGWTFINKQNEANPQDAKYAYTFYKWAHTNPLSPQVGDTLFLSTSRFSLEMGMLGYYSSTREEYAQVRAVIKARHYPFSNHSGPEGSDFMVFEGAHQHIILSAEANKPGRKFQVGIEYRDPKVVEFLPPPMPPKRAR